MREIEPSNTRRLVEARACTHKISAARSLGNSGLRGAFSSICRDIMGGGACLFRKIGKKNLKMAKNPEN